MVISILAETIPCQTKNQNSVSVETPVSTYDLPKTEWKYPKR